MSLKDLIVSGRHQHKFFRERGRTSANLEGLIEVIEIISRRYPDYEQHNQLNQLNFELMIGMIGFIVIFYTNHSGL